MIAASVTGSRESAFVGVVNVAPSSILFKALVVVDAQVLVRLKRT